MQSLTAWARQPTTLTAIALAVGAATYAATRSPELAAAAAAALLGTVNNHTASLLNQINTLEDAALDALHSAPATPATPARASAPFVPPTPASTKDLGK